MRADPSERPNATGPGAPKTVENIQALRGIAALLVVWAHLKFPLMALAPQLEGLTVIRSAHGAIGVDLFFVISGYVISLSAVKRKSKSVEFFLARVARISPLYLAVFPLPFIGMHYRDWPHLSFRSIWNQIFYLPIFDWHGYTVPVVEVGWSLSFEMWFYIAFAILLNFWRPPKVALFLPLLLCVISPLMTLYHGSWYLPRFLFHPFVCEFSFGCLIFHLQSKIAGRLSWFLLIAGIIYMAILSRHSGYLGWHGILLSDRIDLAWLRVAIWGVPAALVASGLIGLERNYGLTLPQPLGWLGGISYSLYLTHQFSMIVVVRMANHVPIHNPVGAIIALLAFCMLIAWLCCRCVEEPLTKRAERWVKERWAARHAREAPVAVDPA